MGNATSSVAEIKKKGDEYNKAVRRERALSGMPGLAQQMSSKRFKKDDPYAEQWKVWLILLFGRMEQRVHRERAACMLHPGGVMETEAQSIGIRVSSASRKDAPCLRLLSRHWGRGERPGYRCSFHGHLHVD